MTQEDNIDAINRRFTLARNLLWASIAVFSAATAFSGYVFLHLNNNFVRYDEPIQLRLGDKGGFYLRGEDKKSLGSEDILLQPKPEEFHTTWTIEAKK